ncbi:hypothetical protein [Micromonospora globbae]|uniref:hypothetical protein n=1 Tax=Micromonospora globbae TaxID=1894969 RepID=UPI003439473F
MRLLVATVLVTGLCAAGGCGGTGPGAASPTGTAPGPTAPATSGSGPTAGPASGSGPPAAPTAGPAAGGGAPAGGNAPAVCAAVQRAEATAIRTYDEELGRMVAAIGANDHTAAETARRRAEAALDGWRRTLREQSARAADPSLAALLRDLDAEVAAMGTDVGGLDETELDRLRQRLDQLCRG